MPRGIYPHKGHPMTENNRIALHNAQVGSHRSPESRMKMSLAKKGKPGHKLGDEQKEALRRVNLGKHPTEETRAKMSLAKKDRPTRYWLGKHRDSMSGTNSPLWGGGVSSANRLFRRSIEYLAWRSNCYQRDEYVCQICGAGGGIELREHHVRNYSEEVSLRCSPDNGVTMCVNCHAQFHAIYGNKHNTMNQVLEFMHTLEC